VDEIRARDHRAHSGGTYIRIYRPRAVIGWGGYFSIVLDGVDRGELWSKQVKELSISSGPHVLQLKQGMVTRSRSVPFEVTDGEVIDFACSRIATIFGLTGIHRANTTERGTIQKLMPSPIVPRNLASEEE